MHILMGSCHQVVLIGGVFASLQLILLLFPQVFLEDFMCALKKRMLMQGRMYGEREDDSHRLL